MTYANKRSLGTKLFQMATEPKYFCDVTKMLSTKAVPIQIRAAYEKWRYFSQCTPANNLNLSKEQEAVAEAIKRDGIYIQPNFLDNKKALALGKKMRAYLNRVKKGEEIEDNRSYASPDYGVYRLMDVDRLNDDAADFFDSSWINEIAKAVTCDNIVSHQRMAELRDGIGKVSSADAYHFDEAWEYKFKAFLYLTDVTEETAPFVYIKGSHTPGSPWRKRKELESLKYGVSGSWGHYFYQEVDFLLKKRYGLEEMVCAAPAGTLILVDTRGIHKATTPQSGDRVMLGNYFEC